MPTLVYRSDTLPLYASPYVALLANALGQSNVFRLSWPDLVWAAATVGRHNEFEVMRHGPYSYFEIIYRAFMVYANLMASGETDPLRQTEAFRRLDPTEKGAVSFFLGIAVSKRLAEVVLDVPWLLHVQTMNWARPDVNVEFNGNLRPDLIGWSIQGECFVVEAKGRTGRFDAKAQAKAKAQTSTILTIDGVPPRRRVASQLYFQGMDAAARFEDPPEVDKDAVGLDWSRDQFVADYYDPIIRLLSATGLQPQEGLFGSQRVKFVELKHAGLKIGLSDRGFDVAGSLRMPVKVRLPRIAHFVDDKTGMKRLGQDGVYVELDERWSDAVMCLEPSRRGWGNSGPICPMDQQEDVTGKAGSSENS